ncbi:MAG: hypothetical protein HY815_32140 [Candidatus Riflebacteria bacterium]|nr:hypothetical protein [Candidatus Riflebacteria bacterium]
MIGRSSVRASLRVQDGREILLGPVMANQDPAAGGRPADGQTGRPDDRQQLLWLRAAVIRQ